METPHKRTLDAGRRVQVFLDTFAAAIAGLVSVSLREKLDAAIAALASFELEQMTAAGLFQGETINQVRLRTELYDRFVLPVVRASKRLLGDAADYPNLIVRESVIRDVAFVPTIQTFRDSAAAHEAILVANVMPAHFLVELDAALEEVKASSDFRSRQLARRKAATQGCTDSFKAVRDYIGIIDASLRQLLKKEPSLKRDWQASKSVRKSPVHPLSTGSLDPTMGDIGSTTDAGEPGSSAADTEGSR